MTSSSDQPREPVRYAVIGHRIGSGVYIWGINLEPAADYDSDHLTIGFPISGAPGERVALNFVAETLVSSEIQWVKPLRKPTGPWVVDFDALRSWADGRLDGMPFRGRRLMRATLDVQDTPSGRRTLLSFECSMGRGDDDESGADRSAILLELQPFLDAFQFEHPDTAKTAFVMMRFSDTPLQRQAFEAVRDACAKFGITALRADHRAYAEDLFPNIRTYMHGCAFGIAIFERIQRDDFNPNVSLEVGYMLALGKPVCLLKDRTLDSLHTDLIGRLYESFDPQSPATSIPPVLEKWLRDRQIIE